jgi:hypothetical protein
MLLVLLTLQRRLDPGSPQQLARLIAARGCVPADAFDRCVLTPLTGDLAGWMIYPESGQTRFQTHVPGDRQADLCGRDTLTELTGKDFAMLGKMLHHKLLNDGEQGQGVITKRHLGSTTRYSGTKEDFVRFELQGHIKFPDGTQTEFRSKGLRSDKIGNIPEGAVVPVRYDASDHSKVVLDVVALEAQRTAGREQAQARLNERKEQAIAEADAKAAQANADGP